MPQTEEHLQIVEYLGARSGVIVLTKADLLPDPAPRAAEVRAAVAGSAFADCPIVPVSAVAGTGIDALRRAVSAQLQALDPAPPTGTPRLAVDRAFAVAGAGTVVTGTLSGGALQRGQEVAAWPGGARSRIRTMESFNRSADRAGPATRVALNLAPSGSSRAARPPRRGDLVAPPDSVATSAYLDARISRSPRTGSGRNAPPLRDGLRVRLHHGTANVAATLRLEPEQARTGLAPGASALGRIHLDEARALLIGDRFVLRDWSQRHTLAGGVVLDPAPRRPLRDPEQRAQLQAVSDAPLQVAAILRARAAADGVVAMLELARLVPAGPAGLERAAHGLAAQGRLRVFDRFVADAEWFAGQVARAEEVIGADLRAHPERAGIPVTALHTALALTGGPSPPRGRRPARCGACRPHGARLSALGGADPPAGARRRTAGTSFAHGGSDARHPGRGSPGTAGPWTTRPGPGRSGGTRIPGQFGGGGATRRGRCASHRCLRTGTRCRRRLPALSPGRYDQRPAYGGGHQSPGHHPAA